MGDRASAFARELFKADQYSDYLYFHGLGVQMAEALAEWVHARIRRELGFADPADMPLRDVLAQRYRGSRYSFGYPACPNVADSRQQLTWLGADRIGLTMDESDQLDPEQSTTALVALHSQARYFSACADALPPSLRSFLLSRPWPLQAPAASTPRSHQGSTLMAHPSLRTWSPSTPR
jgi:5-methyltetrahydrofolate--homocysteine methyltransferase